MKLYSQEAEMAVLGACYYARGLRDVQLVLKPDDFGLEPHQTIYRAFLKLADKSPEVENDPIALKAALGADLEACGGELYLLEIWDCVPSPASATYHATIVKDWAERRSYAEQAAAILEKCRNEHLGIEEIREVAAAVSVTDRTGNPFYHLKDVDGEVPDVGVTTGFAALDNMISTKGYPKGQMTIVSAYHKSGKSTFMVSSYVHQVSRGMRSLYATFADLNAKRVKKRFMRNVSGWSHRPQLEHEQYGYDDALYRLETEQEAYVFDCTKWEDDPTIEAFRAWLRAEHSRKPFDCVFVDYAQKIGSSDKKANNPFAEAAIVSKKLSRLAEQLDIPLVVGSQITEGGKDQKTKTKNGRGLEEDGGWILRLEREDEINAKVEIAYSRFGEQGVELPFRWNNERLRFEG